MSYNSPQTITPHMTKFQGCAKNSKIKLWNKKLLNVGNLKQLIRLFGGSTTCSKIITSQIRSEFNLSSNGNTLKEAKLWPILSEITSSYVPANWQCVIFVFIRTFRCQKHSESTPCVVLQHGFRSLFGTKLHFYPSATAPPPLKMIFFTGV